jgi:hypothetical protein
MAVACHGMNEKLTAANGKNDTTFRDAVERQQSRIAVRVPMSTARASVGFVHE